MRGKRLNRLTPSLAVLVLSAACVSIVFIPFSGASWNEILGIEGLISFEVPSHETSLDAIKDATGFWEQEGEINRFGVRGDICVSNGGEWETRDLSIVDVVQVRTGPGPFADYVSIWVELGEKPVLAPGETACYPYEIELAPLDGARYRNLARATITNHAGWMPGDNNCPGADPCPFGPETKVDFKLPKTPAVIGGGGAAGKRAGGPTPTLAPGDGATEVPVASAEPSATPTPEEETEVPATGPPAATPTPTATPDPTATFAPPREQLPTPTLRPTEEQAPAGCTYSADHWAWNPQSWPAGELELGGQDYSQEEALAILQAPVEADETYPLAQQLIAARLNVENGAVAEGVDEAIQAAGAWLEQHPPGSQPPKPAKAEAGLLVDELQDFNDGLSGPPQCQDDGHRPTPTPAPEDSEEPSLPLVPTATLTPEQSPTGTTGPSLTPVIPSETPAPAATPTPTETPLPTPTAPEELPTETLLPTDTPAIEPAASEEPSPGETPTTPGG